VLIFPVYVVVFIAFGLPVLCYHIHDMAARSLYQSMLDDDYKYHRISERIVLPKAQLEDHMFGKIWKRWDEFLKAMLFASRSGS